MLIAAHLAAVCRSLIPSGGLQWEFSSSTTIRLSPVQSMSTSPQAPNCNKCCFWHLHVEEAAAKIFTDQSTKQKSHMSCRWRLARKNFTLTGRVLEQMQSRQKSPLTDLWQIPGKPKTNEVVSAKLGNAQGGDTLRPDELISSQSLLILGYLSDAELLSLSLSRGWWKVLRPHQCDTQACVSFGLQPNTRMSGLKAVPFWLDNDNKKSLVSWYSRCDHHSLKIHSSIQNMGLGRDCMEILYIKYLYTVYMCVCADIINWLIYMCV